MGTEKQKCEFRPNMFTIKTSINSLHDKKPVKCSAGLTPLLKNMFIGVQICMKLVVMIAQKLLHQ